MDSPDQGPTKRKTLMPNSRSTFSSSILCNIKRNIHHSDVMCASWASSSLAILLFVHQAVHKHTKENNKAPDYWFHVGRNQQRPVDSPHKGPAMWKAFIMQFNSSISGLHMMEGTSYTTVKTYARPRIPSNWQFTGKSIVCSAASTKKNTLCLYLLVLYVHVQ